MRQRISHEDFIRLAFQSQTVADLAEATGMNRQSVHVRLGRLRAAGIDFPHFPRSFRLTPERVKDLQELARSLSQQANGG
ncbi:winged helix-turn-helix domain-containing protein, partial [Acinetobacter baumannii]